MRPTLLGDLCSVAGRPMWPYLHHVPFEALCATGYVYDIRTDAHNYEPERALRVRHTTLCGPMGRML